MKSPFELIMLLCFGFAWPASIAKSLKSRSTKGKSLSFLVIILVGYTAGIIHKIKYSSDFVIYAYILNFAMVSTDLLLYFRNKKLESKS
ncbi:MAG TPA: hypothetical protein DDZ89_05805 [Clostridiales bacterium]|nr:hypothetical protein [Clostridiales bacterium]